MAIYRRIYSSPEWQEAYLRAAFHDPAFPVEELKGDLGAGDFMLLKAAVAAQRRRLDHVLRIVDPRPGQLIADVGCGPGGVALRLADRGARVLALDVNTDALVPVRTLSHRQSRISVLAGDCRRLPIRTAACDAAVCANVLEHVPDKRSCLEELVRILKPGGRLVLYTDNLIHVHVRVAFRQIQSWLSSGRKTGGWRIGFSGCPGGHIALVSPPQLCRLVRAAGLRARVVYSMPDVPLLGVVMSRYFCVIGVK